MRNSAWGTNDGTDFLRRHYGDRGLGRDGYLWVLVLIALDRSPESLDKAYRVSDRACGCDRIAMKTWAGHGSGAEVRWVGYMRRMHFFVSQPMQRQKQRQQQQGRKRNVEET